MSKSEDTLEFLYQYGSRIWERMRFARVRNQRISETTITENLIFDFWYQAKKDQLPVEIYEAKAEKQNGNDIEIFIETKQGYLLAAFQAKILSKKGKCPNISHKVDNAYQIDLLINYAKRKGGQACYLFYNYFDDEEYHDRLEETGKYRYRQPRVRLHFNAYIFDLSIVGPHRYPNTFLRSFSLYAQQISKHSNLRLQFSIYSISELTVTGDTKKFP